MTDWQRLEQVIKWTGLSTNAFATGIGLKRSENLYQIKRGNNRISKNLAELIVRRYGAVNRAWLLTGEGEMLDEAVGGAGVSTGVAAGGLSTTAAGGGSGTGRGIPYYNMDAVRFVGERPAGCAPAYYLQVPGFGDCDFAAAVTGEAMAPEVPPGAVVAVKEVDPKGPVLPGEIYLVVTAEFALMRYVRLDRRVAEGLWLVAAAGSEIEPVGVRRERIVRLYLVKGIVIRKVL